MESTSWNIWRGIQDILFPPVCLFCLEDLQYSKEEILCPLCKAHLRYSDTHLVLHQDLMERMNDFYGFEWVFCKYRFPNLSKVKELIYHFKYKNLNYIGYIEGLHYGHIIKSKLQSLGITHLIPIPIHWRKKLNRGYNQCLPLARGLSESTEIPMVENWLYRKKNTKSQTKLNKADRIKNMKNAFKLRRRDLESDRPLHFLLIDDVLTTGITLSEAAICINSRYPEAKMSVCTLAYKDLLN